MLRAVAKAGVLTAFGRLPRGPVVYRTLTRKHLGTAGSNVDKQSRVWPEYARVWRQLCGVDLEGAAIWIHESGATPFASLAAYLLTGRGGIVTNTTQPVLSRYIARSVNGALSLKLGAPAARTRHLEACRWSTNAQETIAGLSGQLHTGFSPDRVPLPAASVDLSHSGGALEHYRPNTLDAFLRESHRVLRPGGILSHVFDHRDHLYHADKRMPFLAHLMLPGPIYEAVLGHALAYHNRLSPSQVAARFRQAGFERIAVRRLILPSHRYVVDADVMTGQPGIRRSLLAPQFRRFSDLDLRTAAAHYLYRKPS